MRRRGRRDAYCKYYYTEFPKKRQARPCRNPFSALMHFAVSFGTFAKEWERFFPAASEAPSAASYSGSADGAAAARSLSAAVYFPQERHPCMAEGSAASGTPRDAKMSGTPQDAVRAAGRRGLRKAVRPPEAAPLPGDPARPGTPLPSGSRAPLQCLPGPCTGPARYRRPRPPRAGPFPDDTSPAGRWQLLFAAAAGPAPSYRRPSQALPLSKQKESPSPAVR
jgi:hypothetical protein